MPIGLLAFWMVILTVIVARVFAAIGGLKGLMLMLRGISPFDDTDED